MKGLISAFLAEVALISWRNLHNQKSLPPPSQFTAAAIIFGLLGLLPEGAASQGGGVFGWALVGATALNLWNPQTPLNLTTPAAGAAKVQGGTATSGGTSAQQPTSVNAAAGSGA